MPETPIHGFPYPDATEAPAGPFSFEELATRAEEKIEEVYTFIDTPVSGTVTLTNAAGTAYQNQGGQVAKVDKLGKMAILTGMVSRASGTGTTVGMVPAGFRPTVDTGFTVVALGAGNADGPRFYGQVKASGAIDIIQLSGSPAWNTQSWLPLNIFYVTP
jgi:hypothetical protein